MSEKLLRSHSDTQKRLSVQKEIWQVVSNENDEIQGKDGWFVGFHYIHYDNDEYSHGDTEICRMNMRMEEEQKRHEGKTSKAVRLNERSAQGQTRIEMFVIPSPVKK